MVNPGVVSRQLLNPDNSSSNRVTVTEVHLVETRISRLSYFYSIIILMILNNEV